MKSNVTAYFRDATSQVKRWTCCDFIDIYDEVVDTEAFELMVSDARSNEDDSDVDTIQTAAERIEDMLMEMLDEDEDHGFDSKAEREFFYSMRFVPFMDCVDNRKYFPCDVIANRLAKVWCDHEDGVYPHRDIIRMVSIGVDRTGMRTSDRLCCDDFCKAALLAVGLLSF